MSERQSLRCSRRTFAALGVLSGLALSNGLPVWADDVAPIRVIVGYVPGGSLDVVARLVAAEMGKDLNRTIIVENKAGANGNIAADLVARSPVDGSVILATFNTHPLIHALYPNLRFDPVGGFKALGLIAETPYLLVARPDLPGRSLQEVIDLAKMTGRTLSYATVGPGSPQHLSIERLKMSSHAPVTVVHYKGGAPAQQDVIGGHVDMMISTVGLGLPQVQAGKLKALAVSSSRRLPALPTVPTLTESGFSDFISDGWYGLLLPAKTPTDIVSRYNQALNRALAMPQVREALEQMGATPAGGTPLAMEDRMTRERNIWTKVIQENGIKPD